MKIIFIMQINFISMSIEREKIRMEGNTLTILALYVWEY